MSSPVTYGNFLHEGVVDVLPREISPLFVHTVCAFSCPPMCHTGACTMRTWRACQVLTETVPLDPAFEEALNARLVLVFTGKQRLARSAAYYHRYLW